MQEFGKSQFALSVVAMPHDQSNRLPSMIARQPAVQKRRPHRLFRNKLAFTKRDFCSQLLAQHTALGCRCAERHRSRRGPVGQSDPAVAGSGRGAPCLFALVKTDFPMSVRFDSQHTPPRPHFLDQHRLLHRPLPPSDHDLTLVIPAYNEEQRLPGTLRTLADFVSDLSIDCRVLVVDDGSSDTTASLSQRFGSKFSTLVLTPQGGKGRAVRYGVLAATGRVVAFTDADLPYDMQAIRDGYQQLVDGGCDVVFGARDLADSQMLAPRKLSRRIATSLFRGIVQRLVSGEVSDTQCGLKLFRRRAAVDIFSRTSIDGFAFDTEVVLLARRLGYRYRRLPVRLINEYSSTLSLTRHALPMLREVVQLWWRSLDEGYPAPSRYSELELAALDERKDGRSDQRAA